MIGRAIPAYTNPADRLIKMLHAKEKPDPQDIKAQSELFESYDKYIRAGIENEIPKLVSAAEPLDAKELAQQQQNTLYDQFFQLMNRAFKNLTRNVSFIIVRVGQMVVLGLIMMILFWDTRGYDYNTVRDKNGAYCFVCVSQLMLSVQSVILTCTSLTQCSSP